MTIWCEEELWFFRFLFLFHWNVFCFHQSGKWQWQCFWPHYFMWAYFIFESIHMWFVCGAKNRFIKDSFLVLLYFFFRFFFFSFFLNINTLMSHLFRTIRPKATKRQWKKENELFFTSNIVYIRKWIKWKERKRECWMRNKWEICETRIASDWLLFRFFFILSSYSFILNIFFRFYFNRYRPPIASIHISVYIYIIFTLDLYID